MLERRWRFIFSGFLQFRQHYHQEGNISLLDDAGIMCSTENNRETQKLTIRNLYGNIDFQTEGSGDINMDTNLNVNGTLTVQNTDLLTKITEIENILKNHYDALLLLCQKEGMVDSNTTDGSNITPT